MQVTETPGSAVRGAPFTVAVALVARHSNAALLRALSGGPRRFSDLLADVRGVPEAEISTSLRDLDDDRLIVRRVDPGPPLRVLYELTSLGESLLPALVALASWTDGYA
jgi:DNA-binding HxlR family transcriptional regulator